MNASTLQSLIARNAAVITTLDAEAGWHKDRAVFYKKSDEMSFYYDELKLLSPVKKALRKAHVIQNDMLRELKALYARASTVAYLIHTGNAALVMPSQTTEELVKLADSLFAESDPAS